MYHKWRSYDILFLKYKAQQTEFFVILGHFLLFHPAMTQKIKILKNWKNYLRHNHFTPVYTLNDNYMMSGSWDMEWDRENFLSFWPDFYPYIYPLNNPEIQNSEKMKKMPGDNIILHMQFGPLNKICIN